MLETHSSARATCFPHFFDQPRKVSLGPLLQFIYRVVAVLDANLFRLLWQIYSRCFSVPIQVRQYGHRRGLDRMMRSTMACRMAGSVG